MMQTRLVTFALAALLAACTTTTTSPLSTPKDESAARFNVQLGLAYMEKGNLAVAKEKLERAEKENPRDPNVYTALALLYDRLGDRAKADDYFHTALRLAPRDPDISNNYAIYLCKSGRTDEAVKRFRDAAQNALYRTPETAYTNAGVCLHNAKRLDDAALSFARALEIRPNYAEAAYQLGELQFERGKPADARTGIDKYLSAFDATPDLLLLGVRVARALGDRLTEERFARKLRVEFPGSDQTRALTELTHNPG